MRVSSTLKEGDHAPEFTLTAANAAGEYTLRALTNNGPAVLEFLRGTW